MEKSIRQFSAVPSLLAPPSATSCAWNVADVIALYMRRQRRAIQQGKEDMDASTADRSVPSVSSSLTKTYGGRLLASYSPKLLLLGDDAVVQELTAALRAEAAGKDKEVRDSDDIIANNSSAHPPPEVYTMPDSVEGLDALRAELCRWCDVILLCYRVTDPASFVHLQTEILPTVLDACADEDAEEKKEQDNTAFSKGNSADATTLSSRSDVWPSAMPPPLIIVGLGAEARLRRPTAMRTPWITNADVLSYAAEAGVQRVVELYSHSPRHLRILLQHCRTLRDVGYEGLPSPLAQGRRAALKEFGLHALLRAPPPLLELHPGTRSVHVALPPRIPASPATSTLLKSQDGADTANSEGVMCFYTVTDAAAVEVAPAAPSLRVPASGVLSYAEVYAAYTHATGRPVQHAAAVLLKACTVVPYLFSSEVVQQRLPTPTAPPIGYVDVMSRCCRLTLPALSLQSSSRDERGGGAVRLLCAFGDTTTTTTVKVPPLHLRDGRLRAPTSVCVPLDRATPKAELLDAGEACAQETDGVWRPWPSTSPAPSQPRTLQVAVVADDEGGGDDVDAHPPPSATATFIVPPVLPSPVVEYNTLDRSLRMHVPGYRADQVEIRYTLDGSVPTSSTGELYKEAVLLEGKEVEPGQELVYVRAAAYPRLYFASRVAEVHIEAQPNGTLPPPPQLQEDEQLETTPHVQWGSPMSHRKRSPKQRLATQGQKQQHHQRPCSMSSRSPRSGHPVVSPRRSLGSLTAVRASPTGSDWLSIVTDAPTTRSAQLRQAFNAGLYTPPRHPFSQGEGYMPSPRSQRRRDD